MQFEEGQEIPSNGLIFKIETINGEQIKLLHERSGILVKRSIQQLRNHIGSNSNLYPVEEYTAPRLRFRNKMN